MEEIFERVEEILEWGGTKKQVVFFILSAISIALSLANIQPLPFDIAWVAVLLCGIPILFEATEGLVLRFDIKTDLLVALALIAAVCIDEVFAAAEVAFIMQLGEFLEERTVKRARAGIEKLVHLTPTTARVISNNAETVIEAKDVKLNDVLRVLPGETVPVDGVILSGETSLNQSVMTGESLPVDKGPGDLVASGTVNQFGAFDMKATKVGEDSSIQKMIKLVQSADASKAKIVKLADRWATKIVILALTIAVLTEIFTGEIIRAVTVLVVFCPCALVLATPTAIVAAIGNVTKHGFLVREGDALERLSKVSLVTFDKTGTLTFGEPTVVGVKSTSQNLSDHDLFALAASLESLSEHPLGKAVVRAFKSENAEEICTPKNFAMLPGRGVKATVNNQQVFAGNLKLLQDENVTVETIPEVGKWLSEGCTLIYVAQNSTLLGVIALSDTLRPNAENMIKQVMAEGVTPVLLTGDHEQSAHSISNKLGLTTFKANCLPEDKLSYIENAQQNQQLVCMIGDGINDAPALKKSLVGIAMGGVGSDIAVEAADIALVNDDIQALPHLLAISKRLMRTIKLNISFALILNFVAIALAVPGILSPALGAIVHNAGSFLVIINAALLLKWKRA